MNQKPISGGNCPYCPGSGSWGMGPDGWARMKEWHDAGHPESKSQFISISPTPTITNQKPVDDKELRELLLSAYYKGLDRKGYNDFELAEDIATLNAYYQKKYIGQEHYVRGVSAGGGTTSQCECGKVFSSKSELLGHINWHRNVLANIKSEGEK